MRLFTHALLVVATIVMVPSCASPVDAREEFFNNLKALCGTSFNGTTVFPDDPDHPFTGKRLRLEVTGCQPAEIRISFAVGEDRSRTWVLSLSDAGLLLKHDHRHEDGTPDSITMYGGWANTTGTALTQSFPADAATAEILPEAATNVWTLQLDSTKSEFMYYLERHGKPRYRAVFTMNAD